MTHGSLFAGIGGFDLGFERAGFETRWQVEIDPFCNRILERHFPKAKRYGDITKLDPTELEKVDVITGGFPCQPFSQSGKQLGESDERYLWPECVRMLRGIRPQWAVFENVPGIFTIGDGAIFERILVDIHESGYDVEWQTLSAFAFGRRHTRNRVFLVCHADGFRCSEQSFQRFFEIRFPIEQFEENVRSGFYQPILFGMDDGLPDRVDRAKTLGNAVVVDIAEWIAKRIMAWEVK